MSVSLERMIESFDTIIFDLGGVIVDLDYHLTTLAFSQLAKSDMRNVYSKTQQDAVFSAYEVGQITSDEFRLKLRALMSLGSVSDEKIDQAWNAMLIDLPIQRIRYLEMLKKTKRIFLLSNINHIHEMACNDLLRRTTNGQYLDLFPLFERVYFSHYEGLRKPQPEIFEKVLSDNGLNASQTLFVDDSIQHIQSATSLGIKTFHTLTPLLT